MITLPNRIRTLVLFALLPFCGTAGIYDFSITMTYGEGMDYSYQSAFSSAAAFWESAITGYRVDSASLQGINISADVAANDGVGGVLGSAGPTYVIYGSAQLDGDTAVSQVCYSTDGSMTFDSADVDNLISAGLWEQVILHEMAHVIGFGTLWGIDIGGTIYNDFYAAGSGQYTGAAGLAAYQAEFNPSSTFVPVELGGGAGTADGHWDEADGGSALTGITDAYGNDMAFELMGGWLNAPTFVSQTTLAQFYDLGYTIIPEPSPLILIALVCAATFWIRRRFYE
jgi:hypothetical protein